MKRIIHLIVCFVIYSLHSYGQEPAAYAVNEEYNFWQLTKGKQAIVYADKAYIRSSPSLQGKIIDSLTAGTPVQVNSTAYNGNMVKGFYAPWHEITYLMEGDTKTGFIWLGLLALGKHTDQDGNTFIHGLDRFVKNNGEQPSRYDCSVKLIDQSGNITSTYKFIHEQTDQTFVESKLFSGMGLQGIKNIFRIAFIGEACGIPSNYYYVGWNGDNFIAMPSRSSVSDAGVFYHDEQILFPSEHQKEQNYIYKLTEEGEVIDENAPELQYKTIKSTERYIWNGQVFSQLLELK